MNKTVKTKRWTKKIVIAMLAWVSLSMVAGPVMNSAFAVTSKIGGACPDGTREIVNPAGMCANNESTKLCSGSTDKYYEVVDGATEEPAECKTSPAEGGDASESSVQKETLQKFISLMLALEGMLSRLLWPILFMIGGLLNNDILFGAGMEDVLYNIWVPVRNIVNIIFVITLIGLALYSVLGVSGENSQYSVKTMLPKLILGIIAVNFSFLVIKVFLDGVNVLTTSVFALPTNSESILGNDGDAMDKNTQDNFCREVYDLKKSDEGSALENKAEAIALLKLGSEYKIPYNKSTDIKEVAERLEPKEKDIFNSKLKILKEKFNLCEADGAKFILTDSGKAFFKEYGVNNAALAMAINLGEILFYKQVSAGLGSGLYESFAINVIFSLLLYVVYMASFLALFVVLIARLIVMWMGIAFSPIIALSIAVPMAKDKLGLGELTQKFVAHAIAPITIGAAMTIGWIMLKAVKSTVSVSPSMIAMSESGSNYLIPGIGVPGLETLQGLMVSIGTVAVVWVGVFAAADKTIAGKFTGFLKEQLERAGKFAAKAPFMYTPWVPVNLQDGSDKTKTYTPDAILSGINTWTQNIGEEKRREFREDFGIGAPAAGGPEAFTSSMSAEAFRKALAKSGGDMYTNWDKYRPKMKALKENGEVMKQIEEWERAGGEKGELAKLAKRMIVNGERPRTEDEAKKIAKIADKLSPIAEAKPGTTPTDASTPTAGTIAVPAPTKEFTENNRPFVTEAVGGVIRDKVLSDKKLTTEEKTKIDQAQTMHANITAGTNNIKGDGTDNATTVQTSLKTTADTMVAQGKNKTDAAKLFEQALPKDVADTPAKKAVATEAFDKAYDQAKTDADTAAASGGGATP